MIEHKTISFKSENVDSSARIISGYAATWDLDKGGDIIMRGAFAASLASGRKVKVLYQHDQPIGRPMSMAEDEKGLLVSSYIAKTARGDEALELAREDILDSMSIGYKVVDSEDRDGIRYIKTLELYEYSLVTWPMNESAVITSVKSLEAREIERVLREAGLSRSVAKAIACAGTKSLREAGWKSTDEVDDAIKYLNLAIERHQRHMDGTEATDEESQMKMMEEMKSALSALKSIGSEKQNPYIAELSASINKFLGVH